MARGDKQRILQRLSEGWRILDAAPDAADVSTYPSVIRRVAIPYRRVTALTLEAGLLTENDRDSRK
jgi:hypothetical protein